jgi:gluconolactonase
MTHFDVLCDDVDHAECVTWDPGGRLVFGTESGGIWAFDVERRSKRLIANVGGFVLGVAVDGDGDTHACVWSDRNVTRCSAAGPPVIESRGAEDRPFRTPNHLAFHPSGHLYVSDSGSSWEARDGVIFRIAPDGAAEVASEARPAFPNGVAVDESGSYLYVVESSEPRLSRLPIDADGSLGPAELVVELPRTVPDGLALVHDGSVAISCFKPDTILLVRKGRVDVLAEDWQGRFLNSPTNLCFFGPDLDRLAAANIGARTIMEIAHSLPAGTPLHYPTLRARR